MAEGGRNRFFPGTQPSSHTPHDEHDRVIRDMTQISKPPRALVRLEKANGGGDVRFEVLNPPTASAGGTAETARYLSLIHI